jgi:hypothetical protein
MCVTCVYVTCLCVCNLPVCVCGRAESRGFDLEEEDDEDDIDLHGNDYIMVRAKELRCNIYICYIHCTFMCHSL